MAGETSRVFAVVKANGYGHGAPRIARAAIEAGAQGLAVVTLEEASELAGETEPGRVLVMGPLLPGEAAAAVETGFALTCSTPAQARALAGAASPRPTPVHVKVDTGMSRYGAVAAELDEIFAVIEQSPSLTLAGIWTHLATADTDAGYSRQQFQSLVDRAPAGPVIRHAANSAALIRHPEMALDAVRLGIAMYGCEDARMEPVMALRARVGQIKEIAAGTSVGYGRTWVAARDSRIATVTIGYADGVHRARSNRGEVLVRGGRAAQVGRVSMDSLGADVTDIPGVAVGDAVTIFGRDGEESISAEDVAAWSGTISYEILTSVGSRVRRVYQD